MNTNFNSDTVARGLGVWGGEVKTIVQAIRLTYMANPLRGIYIDMGATREANYVLEQVVWDQNDCKMSIGHNGVEAHKENQLLRDTRSDLFGYF